MGDTTIGELVQILVKYGSAPVFLILFVVTAAIFLHQMKLVLQRAKEDRQEVIGIIERVTHALDKSSTSSDGVNTTLTEVKTSLDETRTQTREFMAFLRGRDARGG